MTDDLIAELERATEGSRLANRIIVDETSGCWLWQGGLDKRGRGRISVNGRIRLAHREVWRHLRGEIQNGKYLCHTCDNPQCVNPEHLYVGTHQDNMNDMKARGRTWAAQNPEAAREVGRRTGLANTHARGEKNPKSKLTEQQVKFIRNDPRPTRYVAAEYAVNRTTIQRIRNGSAWAALKARKEIDDG